MTAEFLQWLPHVSVEVSALVRSEDWSTQDVIIWFSEHFRALSIEKLFRKLGKRCWVAIDLFPSIRLICILSTIDNVTVLTWSRVVPCSCDLFSITPEGSGIGSLPHCLFFFKPCTPSEFNMVDNLGLRVNTALHHFTDCPFFVIPSAQPRSIVQINRQRLNKSPKIKVLNELQYQGRQNNSNSLNDISNIGLLRFINARLAIVLVDKETIQWLEMYAAIWTASAN